MFYECQTGQNSTDTRLQYLILVANELITPLTFPEIRPFLIIAYWSFPHWVPLAIQDTKWINFKYNIKNMDNSIWLPATILNTRVSLIDKAPELRHCLQCHRGDIFNMSIMSLQIPGILNR